jgi:hypothetical protein
MKFSKGRVRCLSIFQITVATAQAAPEGVQVPKLEVLNASSLRVSWQTPDVPNGIIKVYRVHFVGGNNLTVYNTTQLSMVIAGKLILLRIHIHIHSLSIILRLCSPNMFLLGILHTIMSTSRG